MFHEGDFLAAIEHSLNLESSNPIYSLIIAILI